MKINKEEIRNLYKEGKSYNEISKILNCTKSTVSYHCSDLAVTNQKVFTDILDEIKKLFFSGKNVKEISKILNISIGTIYIYLKKYKKPQIKKTIKETVKWKKEYRKNVKLKCIEYLGGKCVICGYDKCTRSLDFHHLDPNEKEFTISGGSKSFNFLKAELDKCILVCRNCHGEIHEELDKNN